LTSTILTETPTVTAPSVGMSHKGAPIPPVLDPMELDYLNHSII